MRKGFLKEAIEFLKKPPEPLKVVVMPDFFLDRLVNLNSSIEALESSLKEVASRKGGSIDEIDQRDQRGGNAVNIASALSPLGVKVTPIVCTSSFGLQIMKLYLQPHLLDLSHVKISERPSITTALEFKTENGRVNIMLRDVGSLSDFGPDDLSEDDFVSIREADYVCLFNWAGTKRFGTKLAEITFSRAKMKGKCKTFYDTADPTPNRDKIPALVKNVLLNKNLDILSVNENEATCYASELSNEVEELKKRLPFEDLARVSAKILAEHLSARIDLHTTSLSASYTRHEEVVVPAFDVPILRSTGAGDSWNAGNILADAAGLSTEARLSLANALAGYYVSDPHGNHPTRKQLSDFCEKLKQVV